MLAPSAGRTAAAISPAASRARPRSDGTNKRLALSELPPKTITATAGPDSISRSAAITPTLEHPATSRVRASDATVRMINPKAAP